MTRKESREGVSRRPRLVRAVARQVRRLLRLPRRDTAERALRQEIGRAGGLMRPGPLSDAWKPWANRVLQSQAEADAAITMLCDAGLVPHGDRPKNWDALVALGTMLDPSGKRILLPGAGRSARA